MFPRFLVYCKNDDTKTFFLNGVDGMLFDKNDAMEIHETSKGRIFSKAIGVSVAAISQVALEAAFLEAIAEVVP